MLSAYVERAMPNPGLGSGENGVFGAVGIDTPVEEGGALAFGGGKRGFSVRFRAIPRWFSFPGVTRRPFGGVGSRNPYDRFVAHPGQTMHRPAVERMQTDPPVSAGTSRTLKYDFL